MGQVRPGSATTTFAVRAAIQRSQASLSALSEELGINSKRVAKWRERATVEDLKTGLNCTDGPPELRERYGVSLQTVNRIQKELAKQLSVLCPKMEGDSWRFLSKSFRLRPFVAKNCGARVMRSC